MGEPTTGRAEVKSSSEGGEAELISRSHTGATHRARNSYPSRICVLTSPFEPLFGVF